PNFGNISVDEVADMLRAYAAETRGEREKVYCDFHVADAEHILKERDEAEEWADKLAYAIAPIEKIGEHTNLNSPWQNALEIAATQAERIRELEAALKDARLAYGKLLTREAALQGELDDAEAALSAMTEAMRDIQNHSSEWLDPRLKSINEKA